MSSETILLVEDEPAIRRLMTIALEAAGYGVIEARNGTEALKLFSPRIDLLLTDMRLPYLKGEELIARLRQRRQTLRVLAFSGFSLNAPQGVPFLQKPFGREALLHAVEEVLKNGEQ
jgi:CheY-like chemotaxis protein